MLEGGAKACETGVSLRLVHSLPRRQFRVGGGFPPPPPARAPPVLLPLLRLTCAGDPGAARPGSRRPARRYSASSWTLPHPSPTCPPSPCLARNFPACLSSIPPTHHIDTSQLKPIGSHSHLGQLHLLTSVSSVIPICTLSCPSFPFLGSDTLLDLHLLSEST